MFEKRNHVPDWSSPRPVDIHILRPHLAGISAFGLGTCSILVMSLETINLPHLPSSLPVHVALYRDVQNASFLRQQLLSANADFEYALIDASMVCLEYIAFRILQSNWDQIFSRAHALSAAFRAVNDYLNGRLKSRNVHSEIVYSLSPTNNVRLT